MGMPEEYGGSGADFGHSAVLIEELGRVQATGRRHRPAYPRDASEAKRRELLPKMARGELITAIAMTEPGMGSDLSRCEPVRHYGDDYVINISDHLLRGMVATMCSEAK